MALAIDATLRGSHQTTSSAPRYSVNGAIREVTTGVPLAIASSTTRPKPSLTDGNTSAPAIRGDQGAEPPPIHRVVKQRCTAGDHQLGVAMNSQQLPERFEDSNAVLAFLDAAHGKKHRASIDA